ncbi:MAG: hypothetical protein HUJ25_16090 [Crocinitomicaceae bacterium]|nr:hypothetical protein [Crocinitomicaceae bacterium]
MEEILDTHDASADSGIVINQKIKDDLIKTTKWSKFISIVGFVGLGFMILAALMILANPVRGFGRVQMSNIGYVYFIMALIYFFPIYYLFKFSTNLKSGLESATQISVDEGFNYLRKHYQYVGIVMIIVISIYVLMFLTLLASGGKGF